MNKCPTVNEKKEILTIPSIKQNPRFGPADQSKETPDFDQPINTTKHQIITSYNNKLNNMAH